MNQARFQIIIWREAPKKYFLHNPHQNIAIQNILNLSQNLNALSGKIKYQFSGILWHYSSPGGWYFVSLPVALSKEIRSFLKNEESGWGRLPATAKIGTSEWETAIWFDTKRNTYLLPLKAEIRKKENVRLETEIAVEIWL